jgi:hypothetical protein
MSKPVVGYQLMDSDNECPDEFTTFEILSSSTLKEWQQAHPDWADRYRLVEIHEGDVEDPSFV